MADTEDAAPAAAAEGEEQQAVDEQQAAEAEAEAEQQAPGPEGDAPGDAEAAGGEQADPSPGAGDPQPEDIPVAVDELAPEAGMTAEEAPAELETGAAPIELEGEAPQEGGAAALPAETAPGYASADAAAEDIQAGGLLGGGDVLPAQQEAAGYQDVTSEGAEGLDLGLPAGVGAEAPFQDQEGAAPEGDALLPTGEEYLQQNLDAPQEGLSGPVDEEGYQQQLPHPYYPMAPEGEAELALAEQQLQYDNQMGSVTQPAVVGNGVDDQELLLQEQQRLEAENAALLAEQAALEAEQQLQQAALEAEQQLQQAAMEAEQQLQQQQQEAEQAYSEQPLPDDGQYHEQAMDMGYSAVPDVQYNQPAAEAQYGEVQYAAGDFGQDDVYGDMYGASTQPAAASEVAPAAPAVDVDALLAEEREKHEQQLKLETRAREELEDMILRIEKHFKAEQAARKKAEELLQQAIAAEMDAKNKLEDVMKKRGQEQRLLDEERHAIKRERHALESMRQEFENELQAARSEVAKAQEALAGSEERIRSAEQVERARLESEYQSKLASMQAEMERMRDEMTYRTMVMQDEMENWRQQAQITANAVLEAKGEVLERKRELDSTKEKMDRLLDKLLMGRERGIELSGAIASNQRMLGYLPGMGYGMQQMGGMGQPGMAGGMGIPVSLPPMGQIPAMKVPPMGMQGAGPQGPWMNGFPMPGGLQQLQQQSSLPMANKPKLPPLAAGGYGAKESSWSGGEGSPGPQPRRAASADNAPEYSQEEGQYAHVQSRFAQGAAEVGMLARAKQRGGPARGNNVRAKKADRFEEAEKEAKRNAAMSKWN